MPLLLLSLATLASWRFDAVAGHAPALDYNDGMAGTYGFTVARTIPRLTAI